MRTSIEGCCAGGTSGRPSTANEMLKWVPPRGRPATAPTDAHARKRPEPPLQLVVEREALRVLGVGRVGQGHAEGQGLLRPEAGIDAAQENEAAQEEGRPGQEHHGERDLPDDEAAPQASPAAPQDAAASLPQGLGGRAAARLQGREGPEEDGGDEGQSRGEDDDGAAHAHLVEARNALGRERDEAVHDQDREKEAGRSSAAARGAGSP